MNGKEVVILISIEKIEQEIKELEESGSTSYAVCEKLATLYTVRDHLIDKYGGGANAIGFESSAQRQVQRTSNRREDNRDREVENYTRTMRREDLEREFSEQMNDMRNTHPMEYENAMERMRTRYRR